MRLEHLRLSTKFVLIAVLFTAPVALLGFLYIQQSLKDIRFANRERSGVAYLAEATRLYELVLAGETLTAAQVRALSTTGAEFDTLMSTADSREAFVAAAPGPSQIAAGQLFIQKIADGSWLTLDPDLDSYYLMDAATVNLPELTAATRALGDAAQDLPSDRASDAAALANLLFAIGRVNGAVAGLSNSIETAFAGNPDGAVRRALEAPLQDAIAASGSLATRAAALARQPDPNAPPLLAAPIEARLITLWHGVDRELDRLLVDRAERLQSQRAFNLAVAGLLLGAVVGLMVAVSRSITLRLNSVAATMGDMRGGTLEQAVPHQGGRDEIGAIARTLEVFRERLISLRAFEGEQIAQEASKAAESRFREMLDLSPIGAIIVTPEGTPLYCNAGFAAIIGSSVQSVMSRDIATIWYGPDEQAGLRRRLEEEATVRDLELRLRRADGSPVHCLLSGEPIEYDGAPAALRWVYDITERKKAEIEIQQAQARLLQSEKLASLGQLTAGIAHEIKNPLNFVNNFADLSGDLVQELRDALAPCPLDAEIRAEIDSLTEMIGANLAKVLAHGRRADSIVKNMLLHSRGSGGERRIVDINAVVEESLTLAYHGARAERQDFNIGLEKDLDPAAGKISIMPQEITRVLLNLVTNGFYAADERRKRGDVRYSPTVRLVTRAYADRVEIAVRDNGTGIPDDVKVKLFTPFFTTKPAGEGTGLGLSLSHDIVVKQHGGRIDLQTEPGAFTQFTIVLPRDEPSTAT